MIAKWQYTEYDDVRYSSNGLKKRYYRLAQYRHNRQRSTF